MITDRLDSRVCRWLILVGIRYLEDVEGEFQSQHLAYVLYLVARCL